MMDGSNGKPNFKVRFQNKYPTNNKNVLTSANLKTFKSKGKWNKQKLQTQPGFQNKVINRITYDARQKISNPLKTGLTNNSGDARQKLSNPANPSLNNNKSGDARQKIILSQKQKGTFDARSRIKTKKEIPKAEGKQNVTVVGVGDTLKKTITNNGRPTAGTKGKTAVRINPTGGLSKTLKNEFASGGSQVEMFGNTIQITRSVPNSEVKFDGNNKLTITKRASAIKTIQPMKRPHSPIKWSEEVGLTTPSPPKRANMIKTYKQDVTPTASSKNIAASARLKMPPPPVSSPAKRPIPVILSSRSAVSQTTAIRRANVETIKPRSAPVVKTKSVYRPVPVKQEEPRSYQEADIDISTDNGQVEENLFSPLQGFKVSVTNLDPVVTQDDLIELFGAIGALKRAKISSPGTGEVVYVKREDAAKAAAKYHNRELDGLPMQVKVATPIAARMQPVRHDDEVSHVSIPDSLKFPKNATLPGSVVEIPLIHKALFKTGPQSSAKPVTFTVKI